MMANIGHTWVQLKPHKRCGSLPSIDTAHKCAAGVVLTPSRLHISLTNVVCSDDIFDN